MYVQAVYVAMQFRRQIVAKSTRGTFLGAAPRLQPWMDIARNLAVCRTSGRKKFYTVWEGRDKGVFDNHGLVLQSITKHLCPKYMGFPGEKEALTAYEIGPEASGHGRGGGKGSATKFYAVPVGRKPGVYDNWAEARKQVLGIQNYTLAMFETEEVAREWLEDVTRGVCPIFKLGEVCLG
jgi:hypothetical protein